MHITPTSPRPSQIVPASQPQLALTLLGPSTSMSQLWAQIRRLAPHARTVLLTGAPDCGQEAVARMLLDLSANPRRPFVVLDQRDAEDRLTRSHGPGSLPQDCFLFIQEVAQLSAIAQEGLLHMMRTRRPGTLTVVAATSEDLRSLVGMGRFSPELAETLGSVRVAVPALQQRREDIPMLLSQTLLSLSQEEGRPAPRLSEGLLRASMQYEWTGNLAELGAIAADLLDDCDAGAELTTADWQNAIAVDRSQKIAGAPVRLVKLDAVVQEHIYAVLRACRGNKLRAAEVLGISRSTLYRMLDTAAQNSPLQLAS